MKKVKNLASTVLAILVIISVFFVFGLANVFSNFMTDKLAIVITLVVWVSAFLILANLTVRKMKKEEAAKIIKNKEAYAKQLEIRKLHRGTAYDPYQPVISETKK